MPIITNSSSIPPLDTTLSASYLDYWQSRFHLALDISKDDFSKFEITNETMAEKIFHYFFLQKMVGLLIPQDISALNINNIFGDILQLNLTQEKTLMYAALSANINVLQALDTQENEAIWHLLLDDKTGQSVIHIASLAGDSSVLQWFHEQRPELCIGLDFLQQNIAHYAALSGQAGSLAWIEQNYPDLLQETNIAGYNLAHFAAMSGHLACLIWVSETFPMLMTQKAKDGKSIAHFAASNYHPTCITWISEFYPDLLHARDNTGGLPVHEAIEAPNTAMLDWFQTYDATSLSATDKQGRTLAHRAIAINDIKSLDWIKTHAPAILYQYDGQCNSIVMTALASEAYPSWLWLHEQVELQRLLVIPKDHRLTAYHRMAAGEASTLLDKFLTWAQQHDDALAALKNLLIETLHNITTVAHYQLLLTYKNIWQRALLNEALYTDIDDSQLSGPHAAILHGLLTKTKTLQAIKRIDVTEGSAKSVLLSLQQILTEIASQYVPYAHRLYSPASMLQALPHMIASISEEALTSEDISMLQTLIDSYQEGGLEQPNRLSDAVAETLMALLHFHAPTPIKFSSKAIKNTWCIGFLSDYDAPEDDSVVNEGMKRFASRYANIAPTSYTFSNAKALYPDLSNLPSGARLILLGHGYLEVLQHPYGGFNNWSPSKLAEHLFIDCRLSANPYKDIAVIVLNSCLLAQTRFAWKFKQELESLGFRIGRIDCYDEKVALSRSGKVLNCIGGTSAILSRQGIFGTAPSGMFPRSHVLTLSDNDLSSADLSEDDVSFLLSTSASSSPVTPS